MIDFNSLHVNRFIVHTIIQKQPGQDSASVYASNQALTIDSRALSIIRNRLIDAAGRDSKAFEMEIENSAEDSFFDIAKNLSQLTDEEFVEDSSLIARLLAISQKKENIPGGYLLIMDCLDEETSFFVSIVIKAEPHEALRLSDIDGHNQLDVIERVFLSPSQKFYKIGIVYLRDDSDEIDFNQKYGAILFDDQFRPDGRPAEYFYRQFLGFTDSGNNKIQSKRFYDKTELFIQKEVDDASERNLLLNALKGEFAVVQNSTISPRGFADRYFTVENGLRDRYIADVCGELPLSIGKDAVMIRNKLLRRQMGFPNKIKVVGPEELFDGSVEVIDSTERLEELSCESQLYTIIKISGKPYLFDA